MGAWNLRAWSTKFVTEQHGPDAAAHASFHLDLALARALAIAPRAALALAVLVSFGLLSIGVRALPLALSGAGRLALPIAVGGETDHNSSSSEHKPF